MSERRPDPPEVRASLVDSGWSEPETQPERVLPAYDDPPRDLLVTRVDDQIQSRLDEMRRASEPSLELLSKTVDPATKPRRASSEERTVVNQITPFANQPTELAMPVPVPLPAPLPPPEPIHAIVNPYEPGPSLREALRQRVSMLGGQLPLWGVLVPLLVVTALVTLLLGSLLSGPETSVRPSASVPSPGDSAMSSAASVAGPAPLATESGAHGGLIERAASGEAAALAALEQKKPRDLKTEEALALASGRVAASVSAAHKLRERLASDPGLAKDPHVVQELLKFAQTPETTREALSAMAALPGPIAADLLYEVWTGTAERSGATELAQALLLGRDVRQRASPALAVALDLREAEACEDSAKILERAEQAGDKRSFAPLSRLLRRTGCGPGKKQDCYPCMRDKDELLRKALAAVKLRREPDFLPK